MSRIASLPRRCWESLYDQKFVDEMTEHFRTPAGTRRLRHVQAVALAEIAKCGGGFLAITAGGGKTDISALAGVALNAKRPVLVVPANLRDKTRREFDELRKHFRIPHITIVSYSFLSSEKNAKWLLVHQPDLLIFDEAHKLRTASGGNTSQGRKKKKAAVAVRISRYLALFPDVKCVAMTGTISKDSIMDYAHLLKWCLGEGAPIPLEKELQEVWAACIDVRKPGFDDFRPSFSVLWKDLGRVETLEEVREAYAERLRATPGVIISTDTFDEVPLVIECTYAPELTELEEEITTLAKSWICPDNWPLGDSAAQVWSTMRMLSRGFYHKHVPWPPKPWMEARLAWTKYVRYVCEAEGSLWDTEKQVRSSCETGELCSEDYDRWCAQQAIGFKINREVEWLSDRVVEFIVSDVLNKFKGGGGIVWTCQTELAQALAKRTGWAYHGEMGRDAGGRVIEAASANEIVIASIDANGTGRNLQHWHRNYVTCPPPGNPINEQLLARTHRPGQEHPVKFWFLFACRQDVETFRMAQTEAKYEFQTTKQKFRLLEASVDEPVMGYGPAYEG